MKRTAIYPGTFDPVTYGHIDLIKRATRIFEQVIIAVAMHPQKEVLFSLKERVQMLKAATAKIPRTNIESFDGLLVNYVKRKKARVMLRGLRMISDFEYEFQMALTNRRLNPEIETIYMMPNEAYCYLSSKLIKEAASLGASLRDFVPGFVEQKLKQRLVKRAK
ncbi:MAG: pantetheine-phosphate adenylyltransferase [Candidatus Omnitrophota bacterium]|nr:MAG: pantetheine-phosphate adenylyltransferase [Candidatus Omnitrophota bacterium]